METGYRIVSFVVLESLAIRSGLLSGSQCIVRCLRFTIDNSQFTLKGKRKPKPTMLNTG